MKRSTIALAAIFVVGCATVPDVTFNYYPTTWESTVIVTQTLGCTAAKDRLIVLSVPSVTTRYFSDPVTGKVRSIRITDLSGAFADSDISMTFSDDGRLKGINQSTTGQGEAVVKAAIALATTLSAVKAYDFTITPKPPAPPCDDIERWGGSKPVTLTYRKNVGPANLNSTVTLDVAPESADLYRVIGATLPRPRSTISDAARLQSGARYSKFSHQPGDNVVSLTLQHVGIIAIATEALGQDIGNATVVVPLTETYDLPIPKAALFGKQTFTIGLTDAAAVSSIGYGKLDGTAGAVECACRPGQHPGNE